MFDGTRPTGRGDRGPRGRAGDGAQADRAARRLEARALAFCRLLERWARGEAEPSTPAGARPRCVARPTASRRRSQGWSARSAVTCSSWKATAPRAARGSASPGAAELVDWEPVLARAGVRVAPIRGGRYLSWRSSFGRWRASPPPSPGARRSPRSLWAGSSICARTCSAARSKTCAHLAAADHRKGLSPRQEGRPFAAAKVAANGGRVAHA